MNSNSNFFSNFFKNRFEIKINLIIALIACYNQFALFQNPWSLLTT